MAIRGVLVGKIRRRVNDWRNPANVDALAEVYPDDFYEDAIDDAMGRLNGDIRTTYTVSTLPQILEWVVVLLATISMATTRSSEVRTEDQRSGDVQRVQVTGAEVWFHPSKTIGADSWLNMIKELEDMYQDWLDDNGYVDQPEDLPLAKSYTVVREDLRYNRRHKRPELARPLDAVTSVAIAVASSGGYQISWDVVYKKQFKYYQIERKLSTDDWENVEDVTSVVKIYDNHTFKYIDTTTLVAGTYNYRVVLVNRNGLKSYSSDVSLVVV